MKKRVSSVSIRVHPWFKTGCCAALVLCAGACATPPEPGVWLYPQTEALDALLAAASARGLTLTDHHIHIRGGMTPEKAAERQKRSGIRSAVLENHGREWPLADNARLAAFIDGCKKSGLPVGIQVNDRDWYKQIDPALLERLDFVLADTMIMGVTPEGKPRRLWLPDVRIDDPEAWMEEYLAHNLRILDEPVSILANPTYLPPCIADRYDALWTEARMRRVIAKAVEKGVALEIQAGSPYPKPAFLTLAKSMGAKFSFGTNNHDDKAKDLTAWLRAIELLDLGPGDLWTTTNLSR
jgi:histidinol phosphatase-like PHP family hydrolase